MKPMYTVQVCKMLESELSDVLGDEKGCICDEYDVKLDRNAIPVVHASRSVPAPITGTVERPD